MAGTTSTPSVTSSSGSSTDMTPAQQAAVAAEQKISDQAAIFGAAMAQAHQGNDAWKQVSNN